MQMKEKIIIRVLTTLLGWLVAFVIAYLMLIIFEKQLETASPVVKALIFSGVLVTIMGNVAIPLISKNVIKFVVQRNKGGESK